MRRKFNNSLFNRNFLIEEHINKKKLLSEISIEFDISCGKLKKLLKIYDIKEYHCCKYCRSEENLIYQSSNFKNLCKICSGILIRNKYTIKTDEEKNIIKEKREQTNLQLYGVTNIRKSQDCKKKIKETKLERYGDENYNNKQKREQTCINKFGATNPWKKESIVRQKCSDTYFEKTGYTHNSKNPEVVFKRKETCNIKYGADAPFLNEELKKKTIDTCLIKFGCINPAQNKEIQLQMKNTMLERYGVPHNFCLQGERGYSKISQELFWSIYNELNENLKKNIYFSELNQEYFIRVLNSFKNYYKINQTLYFLDFAIKYNDKKFCIEFNGDLWHANPNIYKAKDHPLSFDRTISCEDIWLKDKIKEENIIQSDFYLWHIWEKDYCSDKEYWKNLFLKEINIFYS
jgi:hypothetical protein